MAGVLSGSFSDRETFARNVESYIPFIKDLLNSFGSPLITIKLLSFKINLFHLYPIQIYVGQIYHNP